jgi:hypothetical protein
VVGLTLPVRRLGQGRHLDVSGLRDGSPGMNLSTDVTVPHADRFQQGPVRPPRRPGDSGFGGKIDAGSHGVLESPPRLVDAASGSVYLRLVPFHLFRLHPPDLRGDFVPCNGDASSAYQFPLPGVASPVDVTLRAGMRPSNVSAGVIFESARSQWSRSGWGWIAYALTPFGWAISRRRGMRSQ